jgi:hypothetical protein
MLTAMKAKFADSQARRFLFGKDRKVKLAYACTRYNFEVCFPKLPIIDRFWS